MRGLTTSALLIVALSGCATPKGVADTASLVAKLSAQMSGQIEEYTAKQNEVRGMDERRLGTMHAATETLVADNRTQFDLIRVTADKDTMRLLESVKSGRIGDAAVAPPAAAATPSTAPVPAAKPVAVRNRFDIAPLTNLAAVAGELAKPRGFTEQIKSFAAFGKAIYEDLKKANAEPVTDK